MIFLCRKVPIRIILRHFMSVSRQSISLPIYALTIGKRSIFRTTLSRWSFLLLIVSNVLFMVETGLVLWALLRPTSDQRICRLQECTSNFIKFHIWNSGRTSFNRSPAVICGFWTPGSPVKPGQDNRKIRAVTPVSRFR